MMCCCEAATVLSAAAKVRRLCKNNMVIKKAVRLHIHVGHKSFVAVLKVAAQLAALVGCNDVVVEAVKSCKHACEIEFVCFDGEFVIEGVIVSLVEGGAENVGTIGLYDACNILQRIIFDGNAHDDDATGSFDRACLCKTVNDINEGEQSAVLTIFVDDRYNVQTFEGDKFECIVDVLCIEDKLFAIGQTELSKRERLVGALHKL